MKDKIPKNKYMHKIYTAALMTAIVWLSMLSVGAVALLLSKATDLGAANPTENNAIIDSIIGSSDGSSKTQDAKIEYISNSYFTVTIPKQIVLDGTTKQAGYSVKVNGDIASDKVVVVLARDDVSDSEGINFLMKDRNNKKTDVLSNVSHTKTDWNYQDARDSVISSDNSVSAPSLTAGSWQGALYFEIALVDFSSRCTHNYALATTPATCIAAGANVQTCTICGDVKEEILDALGHSFVERSEQAVPVTFVRELGLAGSAVPTALEADAGLGTGIECGDFTVYGGSKGQGDYDDYDYIDGKIEIYSNTPLTIRNKNSAAAPLNSIVIDESSNAKITLQGNFRLEGDYTIPRRVKITMNKDSKLTVASGAKLTIGESACLVMDGFRNASPLENGVTVEKGAVIMISDGAELTLYKSYLYIKGTGRVTDGGSSGEIVGASGEIYAPSTSNITVRTQAGSMKEDYTGKGAELFPEPVQFFGEMISNNAITAYLKSGDSSAAPSSSIAWEYAIDVPASGTYQAAYTTEHNERSESADGSAWNAAMLYVDDMSDENYLYYWHEDGSAKDLLASKYLTQGSHALYLSLQSDSISGEGYVKVNDLRFVMPAGRYCERCNQKQ